MATVVITRHRDLVAYLLELGLITPADPVIEHATAEQIAGHDVIGVLPLPLAAMARSVVYIPMAIPPHLRGVELTLEQVRQYAGEPTRYRVETLPLAAVRA